MSKSRQPSTSWFFTFNAGRFIDDLVRIVNGGLSPADNFRQKEILGTTPAIAGAEFTIQHDLGVEMIGPGVRGLEFTYWLNGPGTLYEGSRVFWTRNSFTLRCTDASRNYVVVVR